MTTTDNDLNPVLAKASNEDLAPLVGYMSKKMSVSAALFDEQEKKNPDYCKHADLIASEIRAFGGSTIANFYRGEGPPYKKVVVGVVKTLEMKVSEGDSIEKLEQKILDRTFQCILGQMSDKKRDDFFKKLLAGIPAEERLALTEEAQKHHPTIRGMTKAEAIKQAIKILLIGGIWVFRKSGFKPYKLIPVMANKVALKILGRGLKFATNHMLTKGASIITGPFGWVAIGGWTAIEIASPSYRTTILCVIHVAMLRKRQALASLEMDEKT